GSAATVSNVNPNTGPTSGGTSVTITGTNFSGATAVSFGGNAAASFTVNSATQITATSPAGMGTVDVTVTNENGTSATSSGDRFTYGQVGTTTALSSLQNPSSFGQPVQFAVKVTGLSPTGSVSLFDGGTQVGTGTLAAAGWALERGGPEQPVSQFLRSPWAAIRSRHNTAATPIMPPAPQRH